MSSGSLDPITSPQVWDVVKIGAQTSPGVCELSSFASKPEWDVKRGKGVMGATITFVGRPPSKGSITFKLWTPAHFAQWDLFRPAFKYDPTKKAVQAIDIYHPSLADIDLTSVVCEGIGAIKHEGGQLYTISVDLLEYFPPPKASAIGTPSGSTSAGKGTTPGKTTDPVADAQQAEIAALLVKAGQP